MFFVRRSMLNSAEQCTPILRACCIFQLCFDPAVPYQPGDCVNLEQNLYQGEERYQNQFSTITFDYIGGRSVCYSSIAQVVRETKAAGILGTDLECHFPAKDLVRLSRARVRHDSLRAPRSMNYSWWDLGLSAYGSLIGVLCIGIGTGTLLDDRWTWNSRMITVVWNLLFHFQFECVIGWFTFALCY